MGQVISIEQVAQARLARSSHLKEKFMNFNSIASSVEADELVQITLAIGPNGQQEGVLAHIVLQTPYSAELVLCDELNATCSRSVTCTNGLLPAHYQAVSRGTLSAYLAEHKAIVDTLLPQDAGIGCGRLTLARAVESIRHQGLEPSAALVLAMGVAERCRQFEVEIVRGTAGFFKWAASNK